MGPLTDNNRLDRRPTIDPQNIDTKRRSQRRQCRIGTRKCRCNYPYTEQQQYAETEIIGRHHRQQFIVFFGQDNPFLSGKSHQQNTQNEKQQIDRYKSRTIDIHIFLSLPQRAYRQIFLHDILIEARHDNRNKNPAEKLLEKILFRLPIVKDKNTVDTTAPYRIYDTLDIEVHTQHELSQNKQQRPYHEKGL